MPMPMPLTERRRVLHVHPHFADVLIERLDGEPPMFIRVCAVHQFATHYADRLDAIGACPQCVADHEQLRGRARYAALHAADVRVEGWR